ncbi:hypothetical protein K438DRAFT_1940318 [Mycena galopus ATCC 62051]|nr:hypothetical protein K438DRAFT_1940318 [Mycena galopus ATCC 62051]
MPYYMDWLKGAVTGNNYWVLADAFIAARREGRTDRMFRKLMQLRLSEEQSNCGGLTQQVNYFVNLIPLHLRWDPENPPYGPFFDKAAILYISYNHILIAIHWPYIKKASAHGALSICARATRGILDTARIWLDKLHRIPLPSLINPVFVSCLILIVYMMGTKRADLPIHKNKDLAHVETAMEILKVAESRMQPMGPLRDIWSLDGSLLLVHRPHE